MDGWKEGREQGREIQINRLIDGLINLHGLSRELQLKPERWKIIAPDPCTPYAKESSSPMASMPRGLGFRV